MVLFTIVKKRNTQAILYTTTHTFYKKLIDMCQVTQSRYKSSLVSHNTTTMFEKEDLIPSTQCCNYNVDLLMSSFLLIMKNFSKYNKTPTFLFLSPIQNK